MLGYTEGIKAYKLYDIPSNKVIYARSVTFDETKTWASVGAHLHVPEPDDSEEHLELSHFDLTDHGTQDPPVEDIAPVGGDNQAVLEEDQVVLEEDEQHVQQPEQPDLPLPVVQDPHPLPDPD